MTGETVGDDKKLLDYLKRVTADLRETRRRLEDVEHAVHEPVAIIGIGCRFPGAVRCADDLWDLVADGREGLGALPADRGWDLEGLYDPDPEHPGTSYVRRGGFVADADRFDAAFFGISPHEAVTMAPQQRLALELAWEAVEHARIDPHSLRGSGTGTYLGCDGLDYFLNSFHVPEKAAGYLTTGNSPSVVAGRVAYTLGLEGAAVTLDTACSSSLVAIHLACQALRQGEVELALAGGVYVMSSPAPLIGFSELRALAPDGRSKPFSADADGMTLSEGAGLVLLERLSDARRNGHRVLAVVRGTAVNEDGASNGLTAPNGLAQQRVIQQALANARLAPSDVDAVEAHGTGTSLGDPIEAGALAAVYGRDRSARRPLRLGSVKSNIGHTQIAAGVAGVIKMVMALRRETLPRSLHADRPTAHVDWDTSGIRLLDEAVAWPRAERPRRAGVSAFGFSGTNAHVILEEAPGSALPSAEPADQPGAQVTPWVLSARSATALRDQARRLLGPAHDNEPRAVGWSLASTRSTFEHRAVVTGADAATLRAGLAALAAGEPAPGLVTGPLGVPGAGPVLVFPGQGSQWPGMGAELLDASPVFAEWIARCECALAPHTDWSLTEVLRGAPGAADIGRVDVVQPVLWALMVSLAALWAHHGVRPAAVVGHSQGEIAAACVAGAISLEEGARIVALRSQSLRALAGRGAMASLGVGPDAAERLIADLGDAAVGVGVAAVNSPTATVVSGPPGAVASVVAACEAAGARARMVDVDYASHGPQVDAIAQDVTARLAAAAGQATHVSFYSTVTGAPMDTTALDADYWLTNLRHTVRFSAAVDALLAAGHRVFIEVSPHAVVVPALQECFEAAQITAAAVGTLRRGEGGPAQLATALGQAFVAGTSVDWRTWFADPPAPATVDLPTYAFDRERYWLPTARTAAGGAASQDPAETELWNAIEGCEAEELARVLESDGDAPDVDALRPAMAALSTWRRRHRERGTLASWRHRIRWASLPDSAPPELTGTWLVLAPTGAEDHPATRTVTAALTAHGADIRSINLDPCHTSRADLAEQLTALRSIDDLVGVISLLALDERSRPGHSAVPAGLAATVAAIQALGDCGISAPLWCVTQGAVSTGADEPLPHPRQAQTWAVGRVAALEHADRWGGLIDLPTAPDDLTTARLASLLAQSTSEGRADAQTEAQTEDQIAIRATGLMGRRLVRAPADRTAVPLWQPKDSVLITGGTGGVGALLARWAAGNGASHLVLTSRRGPDAPGAPELAAELRDLGATVDVVACDASDREAMAAVLGAMPAEHPLSAVIHAAGVSEQDLIADVDDERLSRMLAPKALAAWHLHELTRDLDLSAFVLFSSVTASWGSGQQAAYAAANAYLDALAEHRRGLGLPATSVAWGLWGEVGMATADEELDFFRRRGLHPLDPGLAVKALRGAIGRRETNAVIAAVDWSRFLASFTALRPSPLLSELPEAAEKQAAESRPAEQEADPLRRKLAGSSAAERRHILVRHVQAHAAGILGHPSAEAIPPNKPFQQLGFDSLTAVQLRNELNASTGLRLPTAVLFDHPTAEELADHLHGLLVADAAVGEHQVMSALELWDAASSPDSVGEAARARVAARLRLLADKWDDTAGTGSHGDLEAATAEEIFDLIAAEFGKS